MQASSLSCDMQGYPITHEDREIVRSKYNQPLIKITVAKSTSQIRYVASSSSNETYL